MTTLEQIYKELRRLEMKFRAKYLVQQRELMGLKDTEPNESKPLPNEFSCRLADPKNFDKFARKNNAGKVNGKPVHHIYGIKNGKSTLQAIRYPKSAWTSSSAKSHCRGRKGKFDA